MKETSGWKVEYDTGCYLHTKDRTSFLLAREDERGNELIKSGI